MTSPIDATSWTVGKLLTWTKDYFCKNQIDEPRLSAELLLAHALGSARIALYTRYDQTPTQTEIGRFRTMVKRRKDHEPVAYITGKACFFSMELFVSPDVLIPRPDTETLVEQAITALRVGGSELHVLDLCTGSGCAALAIAKSCPQVHLTATDISTAALAIAQKNADLFGLADRISFLQGDLFAAMDSSTRPFQVITANPPYIPSAQIESLAPEIAKHEPRLALDGGVDGLQLIGRIVADAPNYLASEGLLLIETAYDQTELCAQLMAKNGHYDQPRVIQDAARNPRCVAARVKAR